jgi:hypothetical protein
MNQMIKSVFFVKKHFAPVPPPPKKKKERKKKETFWHFPWQDMDILAQFRKITAITLSPLKDCFQDLKKKAKRLSCKQYKANQITNKVIVNRNDT